MTCWIESARSVSCAGVRRDSVTWMWTRGIGGSFPTGAPTMPVRQILLLVLWDAEFDDAVAGVEPAGGGGFGSGEEVHAFGAVGVGVAEQGGPVRDDPLIGNLGEISMRCRSVPSVSRRASRR